MIAKMNRQRLRIGNLILGLSLCVAAFLTAPLRADEGMIPVSELGKLKLASKGMQLRPDEIFNPNGTCLLDGIVRVNGCTGSFVSNEGLLITNHHCAYGAIQSLSTTAHDYLKDGFQAKTRSEELPAKGYTVRITESVTDVSQQVLSAVSSDMSLLDRTKAVERRRKEIEKKAEENSPTLRAEVAEMFSGKTYWLFQYTYLKDVRLVFAPPQSIGNFGGEIDNWEWPRHTGDFSFMRAYVAPDGSSADYSPNNVPYKPKRFIQVAPEGVNEGDFVFLLGYPGKTSRHKTVSFLEYEQNVRLPYIVELYGWQIATMEAAGKNDRAVALKHAAQIRSLANVEKRSRGQLKGLSRKPIIAMRQAEESQLRQYIQADAARNAKYGKVLEEINSVYAAMTADFSMETNLEQLRNASRSVAIAATLVEAAEERKKDDIERETPYMDRNFDQTIKSLMLSVSDLDLATDKILLKGMLKRLSESPKSKSIPALAQIVASPETIDATVDAWLNQTRLGSSAFVEQSLKMSSDALAQSGDPVIQFVTQLYPHYIALRQLNKERTGQLDKSYGLLLEVKEQFLNQSFIPDANSTLRLTFGHVRGYSPEDGLLKTPVTTLKGVIDKSTDQEPFDTPRRVHEMFAAKDFGSFQSSKLGTVPVAILYDTDTTGGNSGSPVLNSKGQLVGVNFDRAFEATINDFAWNVDYSRSIGVDIRYCLWITGKVYGARHLLTEMNVPTE